MPNHEPEHIPLVDSAQECDLAPLFLVIQGTNLVHQEFAFVFFSFLALAALYVTYIFSCMCTFLDISPSLVYIVVKSPKTLTF